jgi:hypothetical protein
MEIKLCVNSYVRFLLNTAIGKEFFYPGVASSFIPYIATVNQDIE